MRGNRLDRRSFVSAGAFLLGDAALAGRRAAALQTEKRRSVHSTIKKESWGLADGIPVDLWVLTNSSGMTVKITSYGGIVTELHVPDKSGHMADVVLGFDSLQGYLKGHPYFGALVGRYANRIARGRFKLDGKEYTLAVNNPPNHLHGGNKGWDKAVWKDEIVSPAKDASLRLTHESPDGDEGYPGSVLADVTYTLTHDNALRIDYHAASNRATPINLTNHSYFNLAGQGKGNVLGHELMLNCDRYTPTDDTLIPTGEIVPVKGTPFDFTKPHTPGERIARLPEFLGGGYDNNYVINKGGKALVLAARVHEPKAGRVMEVWTDQPGVQLYTGNFLDGALTGKGGAVYKKHDAFCLETQHYPDSPNKPDFPSTILKPGAAYRTTTIYRFSAR